MSFKRLHLGCGPLIASGFLNVDERFGDLNTQLEPGIAYRAGPPELDRWLMRHDLRQGIPAAASSLDIIYHAHLLEHLNRDDGVNFLRQCHRCLRDSAVMRFAVPDLALWARHYVQGNDSFFEWYRANYLGATHPQYQTNGQVFMGMIYNHGHRMAYDFQTLARLLTATGFVDVRQCAWGRSEHIEAIAQLESTGPGMAGERRHESLVVECRKPGTD